MRFGDAFMIEDDALVPFQRILEAKWADLQQLCYSELTARSEQPMISWVGVIWSTIRKALQRDSFERVHSCSI